MSCRPSSSSTSLAALTWPRPPSITTRSGIASGAPPRPPPRPPCAAEAPSQHLPVAGEVVAALDGPDPEAAVLAGARPALLEHDHAADRLRALEVADVVALDAHRRRRQAERAGELLERAERLALVGQPARLLARERLLGVARRELHELAPLAALRRPEVRPRSPAAPTGTPRAPAVSVTDRGTRTRGGTLVARA